MEVTSQPRAFATADFSSDLTSCCDDMKICCCGMFCLSCLGCSIASDMGECCLCGHTWAIRSVYRTKYNIRGSMCNDCVTNYFCMCCATCQLKRDIEYRKQRGEF